MLSNRIGRYEIRSRLGSGAFATVYEAFDPRLESVVAIKLLADNWVHEPDVVARFRQEAVLLRRVQTDHPAAPLLDVYDIDETVDGRPYFVMRVADRGSLEGRSNPGQTWTAAAVEPVVDVLEQALSTLHQAGIVHRDVKPSNLLIAGGGGSADRGRSPAWGQLIADDERVMLGDLGLAKDLLVSGSALTVAGGTPRFMAPEQRDPGAAIDHRADLFAATAVVVDLITGSPVMPDEHSGLSEVARGHFARGLSADPSQRHTDAASWAAAMRSALANLTVAAPAATTPTRRLVVPIVGALLAMVLLGGAAAFVLRGDDTIVGDRDVQVGETLTLVADVEEEARWVWTVGGRQVADLDLVLTPDQTGFIEVVLEVTAADGSTETSTARISVTE